MAAKAATDAAEIEDQGQPAAGGGKKKLIMIIAAVAVLAAGGGGAYFFMFKKKDAQQAEVKEKKAPVFFDLPEVTVNLSPSPGIERQQYLKIKVALEVADQKMVTDIQPVMPRVLDNFQVFLRELRASDLEGSPGLYRLKEELVRRINAAVYPAKVEAVLFKDILVQ